MVSEFQAVPGVQVVAGETCFSLPTPRFLRTKLCDWGRDRKGKEADNIKGL